jgi:hypothetical protein
MDVDALRSILYFHCFSMLRGLTQALKRMCGLLFSLLSYLHFHTNCTTRLKWCIYSFDITSSRRKKKCPFLEDWFVFAPDIRSISCGLGGFVCVCSRRSLNFLDTNVILHRKQFTWQIVIGSSWL